MKEKRKAYKSVLGRLKEGEHLEHLEVGEYIYTNCSYINRMNECGIDSSG
jgi:hypothetical protein